MLLQLRVRGFKNLKDVTVRFGPLTCFVGPNGVGKSNLFDAVQFLRKLAETDIHTAAESIRGPALGSPAPGGFRVRELFWSPEPGARMSFDADIVVPREVTDEFGARVAPAITLLRYEVAFGHTGGTRLELVHEELRSHRISDAPRLLAFPHSRAFCESVVVGRGSGRAFISTRDAGGTRVVQAHGDGGRRGLPAPAAMSRRTILGGTNTNYFPTVFAARTEMSSWHALHLEPSSLRTPDPWRGSDHVDEHGAHIAAALHRLERERSPRDPEVAHVSGGASAARRGVVAAEAANRLARLVPEVMEVRVNDDPTREQRVVELRMRGTAPWLGPRALSDGTLRFLALVTMQMDPQASRILCMEEPENGIHPARIPAMVDLLQDFAVDADLAGGPENPVRQVVVNTHSPEVLRRMAADQVLFVDTVTGPDGRRARVRPVDAVGNWRGGEDAVSLRALAALIGGAPLGRDLADRQLELRFGTAT